MPAQLGVGNAQYTQISTNGTTFLTTAAAVGQPPQSNPGAFYGANLVSLGTAPVLTVLDLIPPAPGGTSTATVTNTIYNGTGTAAGQVLAAGPGALGIRYRGSLVVVTSGTAAGTWNALWD